MNDSDLPTTQYKRYKNLDELLDMDIIMKESYNAVIHRFTRGSIEPVAAFIKSRSYTDAFLKILLSSMMTVNYTPISCQLNEKQEAFFIDTIGSIYLIGDLRSGEYSFYEGYVIDAFLPLFQNELSQFKLLSSLNLIMDIIRLEGKKTSAKGAPFEAVVVADIICLGSPLLSDILWKLGFHIPEIDGLRLPQIERKFDDETIISERPVGAFMRPYNQFRSDILAFLSKQVRLSFGIKLHSAKIPSSVHTDNFESTDPSLFFFERGPFN